MQCFHRSALQLRRFLLKVGDAISCPSGLQKLSRASLAEACHMSKQESPVFHLLKKLRKLEKNELGQFRDFFIVTGHVPANQMHASYSSTYLILSPVLTKRMEPYGAQNRKATADNFKHDNYFT